MEFKSHQSPSDLYRSMAFTLDAHRGFGIHFLPELHDKLPFKSPYFRSEYFSFVFVKEGSGTYTVDDKTYQVEANTVYFTNPGHIKSFEIKSCDDAFLIGFTEAYLRENVHPDIFSSFPFLLAESLPPKQFNAEEYSAFEAIYKIIFQESKSNSENKDAAIGNLFVALLLKTKDLFGLNYQPLEEGNRSSQLVRSFKELMEREFQKLNSKNSTFELMQLNDYANKLNLHPNYLNAVIKSKTGKTVSEWIRERSISVAKTLLKNSSYSAKEIAFLLGFSEATHFSRFFKKHTQLTPSAFRKGKTS